MSSKPLIYFVGAYPEGVPEWVTDFFKPPVKKFELHPTNIEGIFVPVNPVVDIRTFAELPDEEPIWL